MDGSWSTTLDCMMKTPLLFIDDLDKAKFTEAVETQLFGLLDWRSTHLRPVISTLNSSKGALEGRFSEARAGGIVRRLKEFSTVVKF
jgi:DNA replication protein DnaC